MSDRGDMNSRERRIRERAEKLWEEAGKPVGQDDDIWHEAELQIEVEDRKSGRA